MCCFTTSMASLLLWLTRLATHLRMLTLPCLWIVPPSLPSQDRVNQDGYQFRVGQSRHSSYNRLEEVQHCCESCSLQQVGLQHLGEDCHLDGGDGLPIVD